MSGHTPGPWEFRAGRDGSGDFGILARSDGIQSGYVVVAEVYAALLHRNERSSQTLANARLIAAAPRLLDAIRICLKAERERRKKLLPGAPARTYTDSRISMIETILAEAESR